MIDKERLAKACDDAGLSIEFKERILNQAEVKGPFWAVCEAFVGWGRSGLTPFALAGIAGISPRRVMLRIKHNPNVSLLLGFCGTTRLPVYSANWSSTPVPLRDKYLQDLRRWLENDAPYEEDPSEEEYSLERLLRLYGGKTWRTHCTPDFNPHEQDETFEFDPDEWEQMKQLYRAARKLA